MRSEVNMAGAYAILRADCAAFSSIAARRWFMFLTRR
jgi:hypothetical protein